VIVLDTPVWLWLGVEPKRLSVAAGAAIRQASAAGGLAVASVSLWEIAMMIARGMVTPTGTPEAWLSQFVEATGVVIKDITPAVATLAATARAEGLDLITRDAKMRASRMVHTVW
jgi:PIN domain nuclease of toxin-antitoxin system